MKTQWTVKHKMIAGFTLVTALTAAMAAIAVVEMRVAVKAKDAVIDVNLRNLIDVQKLATAVTTRSAGLRGYLLSGESRFADTARAAGEAFAAARDAIAQDVQADESRRALAEISRLGVEQETLTKATMALRGKGAVTDEAVQEWLAKVTPVTEDLQRSLTVLMSTEEREAEAAKQAATARASSATTLVIALALFACVLAVATAFFLGGGISRQIGTAIQSVQSSSAELQAAANQQAAGSKEQSAAMTEVTTTLKELVATSRQMAESSQRVTRIAETTGGAAQAGDLTVQKAQGSIGAIKRQVDLIVTHMLDLGKKSQQVGGILEIINELAEQTNILAINASIESAGAGEAGRRFGVVADEIRRLADRVGGSTKEIRGLIDEIRGAANTTVMVTEDGLKAVDAGSRQFGEVTAAFRQIAGMVDTTTDAAREIELGTKQQVTAIEQVNAALADITQAARETEASTRQTLATSSELATLSRKLNELIRRSVGTAAATVG